MALPFVLVPVPVPRQVLIEMVTSQPTLAVITGGSRGIGLGIAKQLAIKHDILIVCRSAPSEEKVAELKSVRPNATIEYVIGLDCADTQKVHTRG